MLSKMVEKERGCLIHLVSFTMLPKPGAWVLNKSELICDINE